MLKLPNEFTVGTTKDVYLNPTHICEVTVEKVGDSNTRGITVTLADGVRYHATINHPSDDDMAIRATVRGILNYLCN